MHRKHPAVPLTGDCNPKRRKRIFRAGNMDEKAGGRTTAPAFLFYLPKYSAEGSNIWNFNPNEKLSRSFTQSERLVMRLMR